MNDALVQEKLAYFHQRSQYVVFDDDGRVQDSCQTLFSVSSGTSLYECIPFIEAMREAFLGLEVGRDLSFLCVKTNLLGREGYFNFYVKRPAESQLQWFVYDLTEFYLYLQPRQQERNDQAIAGEHLRLQQRTAALEKELLQYRHEELRRMEEMKSAFFSQVSHEMRTPLNNILGLAHLIAEQADPSLKTSVEALFSTARHLSTIVNDVLDWSKLESSTLEVHNAPFSIQLLMQNITQPFQVSCQDKGVELSVSLEKSLPEYLIGDTTRVSQILYNLLGNAVKFTSRGEIRVSVEAASRQAVSARDPSNDESEHPSQEEVEVRFVITDTGIGMSGEEKDRIANPYIQANNQIHQRYGGTGLGLSIVQKLVERLNGSWNIESQPQQGTAVTVQLPFFVSDRREEPAGDYPGFRAIRKVLIAEDDPISRKVLDQLLLRWKLQTTVVEDGQQALEHIHQDRYDLLILDYQMPALDGAAVLQALRQEPQTLPVIVLSGNIAQVKLTPQQMLSTHVLSKPVLPTQLHEKIKLLDQQRAEMPVDLHYLRQITDGQQTLMVDLIDTFIQQAPEAVHHIRQAWQDGDASRLCTLVHKAKPGFQYVGATTISQRLDQLEDYVRRGQSSDQYDALILQLEEMARSAVRQLEEERKLLLRP